MCLEESQSPHTRHNLETEIYEHGEKKGNKQEQFLMNEAHFQNAVAQILHSDSASEADGGEDELEIQYRGDLQRFTFMRISKTHHLPAETMVRSGIRGQGGPGLAG